ncbi:Radical SAM superfamily protein [uncultured archaeon]|nr:Radical SAM superfamily protein [uncultured archaeon]
MNKEISDFLKYNFCNAKKIYYKNKFIIEDCKSITALATGKKYKKELLGGGIFPSTYCNANCTFCANRHIESERGIMPFEIFKKAVDEFKELGITSIGLTPMIGEPLLDNGLFEKIDYIYENKMTCSFYTNGFLIKNNIDKILSSKLETILIDVADVIPLYESKVFQVSEEQCRQKLDAILELIKRNKKINIQLSFRPMREFNKIIKDMKKTPFWEYYQKGLFKMDYLTAYDNWGGSISKKDLIGFQTMSGAPKIKKYPCQNLFGFSILPNGNIRACGCRVLKTFDDELIVGNILKMTLKEAFNSEKYDSILAGFENGTIPKVCEKCTFYIPKI